MPIASAASARPTSAKPGAHLGDEERQHRDEHALGQREHDGRQVDGAPQLAAGGGASAGGGGRPHGASVRQPHGTPRREPRASAPSRGPVRV
jgi:hypothetical protein